MANTASAKKRAASSARRRIHNMAQRSRMRTYIKKVLVAVADNNRDVAEAAYRQAVSITDKYADKGLLHKNTAARKKSRLHARIKAMSV